MNNRGFRFAPANMNTRAMLLLYSILVLPTLFLITECGSPEPVSEGRSTVQPPVHRVQPDIVIVMIDSLRYDHLGCYGYARPTSPQIDCLATEGVRFQNAISTTSWTLPAHAALFTGLFDETHGLLHNDLRLSDNMVTLAELLRGVGYRTAGFYGGPYLHPTYGLSQGFDTWVSCITKFDETLPQDIVRTIAEGDINISHSDITGYQTLEKVRLWLQALDDRPFFLFLHLWDVHYDYIPPAHYIRMFDPDYNGALTGNDMMHNPDVRADMPRRDLEHLIALYDGEIRFTDDILSNILAEINGRKRLHEALVVVTADHGEEFFEHGYKGHQRSLYEEVVRIPLIFRWLGRLDPGHVVKEQVRIIDIMPTVASLADVSLRSKVQGRDISPLLRGGKLKPEAALCTLHVTGMQELHAVRTNRQKLITSPSPYEQRPNFQFFDLMRDPGELITQPIWTNGYYEARSTLNKLRRESRLLSRRLGETVRIAPPPDNALREKLRSLGYLIDNK